MNKNSRKKDKIYVHLYYDSEIHNNAEITMKSLIRESIDRYSRDKNLPSSLQSIFDRFINVDKNGNIEINIIEYTEYLLTKGIRILVSNIISEPIEAWKAYHERSEVEHAFKYYKQRIDGRRMRIGSENTLDGKLFLQFLATSLAIMFRRRMNKASEELKKMDLAYDSAPILIKKLCTIEETDFDFGSYYSEIVGSVRNVLEAMSIPIPTEKPNSRFVEYTHIEKDTIIDYEADNLRIKRSPGR